LLEEAQIKLTSLVSDLFGLSGRRMLHETDPAALAARAHHTLRATPEQLCDDLRACAELNPAYRQQLKMSLKELQLMEEQIDQLDQQLASWVGVCPGQEQRAEQSTSDRFPKGTEPCGGC